MEEEIKKGNSNFSKYYITEELKEILKEAYKYKKIAKKAYLFILLITLGGIIIPGIIVGLVANGNPIGYIIGRNNRVNNWNNTI